MSRFHIYRLRDNGRYVIDLQADLFESLKTRIVAPLLKADEFQTTISRLAPQFEIGNTSYVAAMQMMSAIPASEFSEFVIDASDKADEITAAIDFVFQGF